MTRERALALPIAGEWGGQLPAPPLGPHIGLLAAPYPPPPPSTQLRVQTCLASNLSPGLAQPSSGLLFLAQPTNCFMTLGKSPRRLTPSVRTEVAREKRALWTPRHLEVTPCLSSQVAEEPWEGCLRNTWRPSACREPLMVAASDAEHPRREGGHASTGPGETGPPGSQVTLRVVQSWLGS